MHLQPFSWSYLHTHLSHTRAWFTLFHMYEALFEPGAQDTAGGLGKGLLNAECGLINILINVFLDCVSAFRPAYVAAIRVYSIASWTVHGPSMFEAHGTL